MIPSNHRHPPVEKLSSFSTKASSSSSATGTTHHYNHQREQLLWIDKYKPQHVNQSIVALKKIEEIRQFLISFSSSSHGPRLLILTGSPGIGKSTTLCLLAKEYSLNIIQCNQPNNTSSINPNHPNPYTSGMDTWDPLDTAHMNQFTSFSEFLYSTCFGYHSVALLQEATSVSYSSTYESLDPKEICSKPSSFVSKKYSNIFRQGHYHLSASLVNDTSRNKSIKENIKNGSSSSSRRMYDILGEFEDVEEDDQDHGIQVQKRRRRIIDDENAFILDSSTSHTSSINTTKTKPIFNQPTTTTTTSSTIATQRFHYSSIILIEELPNLHTPEREEQCRQLMSHVIAMTQVPIVFIFSDVYEGKYKPEDLERILHRNVLYSPLVQIIEINPVTKQSMKKCIDSILQVEFGGESTREFFVSSKSKRKSKSLSIPMIDSTWIDEIHSNTGGDLRQVIMTLQFLFSTLKTKIYDTNNNNNKTTKKIHGRFLEKDKQQRGGMNLENHTRDITLSSFHALGKLLYAKRKIVTPASTTTHSTTAISSSSSQRVIGRSIVVPSTSSFSLNDSAGMNVNLPLDFDPERVMEGSSMGLFGALSFLGYHSPDFFTDITELSEAFDSFSDAAFFMDKLYTGLGDTSSYPLGYASSFASRAVAQANKHPAPKKFRQFTSPKYFQIVRKREANQHKISQMLRRISCCDEHLQKDVLVSATNIFFTESFSFLHRIIPSETLAVIQHMQMGEGDNSNSITESDHVASMRKQKEILELDDIVDSDDDKKAPAGVRL